MVSHCCLKKYLRQDGSIMELSNCKFQRHTVQQITFSHLASRSEEIIFIARSEEAGDLGHVHFTMAEIGEIITPPSADDREPASQSQSADLIRPLITRIYASLSKQSGCTLHVINGDVIPGTSYWIQRRCYCTQ
jgi:hypothetical protein